MRKRKVIVLAAVMACMMSIPSYAGVKIVGHSVNVTASQPGVQTTQTASAAVTSANTYGAWATDDMVQVRPTVFLATPTTSGYGSTQTTVTQKNSSIK